MTLVQHQALQIDCIDQGRGAPVVLVHSSVSGNRQWRRLVERLSPRRRVIAPNLLGYGATTPWPAARPQAISDALQVLLGAVAALVPDEPLQLVGHSWGGALALHAAHRLGDRVSRLVLYEPMLPGLLAAHGRLQAATETRTLHAQLRDCAARGDWLGAAERFTDYFNGDGTWAGTPPPRRRAIADALPPNLHEWDAAMAPLHADALAGVRARTLLMRGRRTRAALHEMSALLYRRFAHWRLVDVAGCGHMAPLTHADTINHWIADFLDEAGGPARVERTEAALA